MENLRHYRVFIYCYAIQNAKHQFKIENPKYSSQTRKWLISKMQ